MSGLPVAANGLAFAGPRPPASSTDTWYLPGGNSPPEASRANVPSSLTTHEYARFTSGRPSSPSGVIWTDAVVGGKATGWPSSTIFPLTLAIPPPQPAAPSTRAAARAAGRAVTRLEVIGDLPVVAAVEQEPGPLGDRVADEPDAA